MARLTRKKDQFPCRCADCYKIEQWIMDMGGDTSDICENCPIQPIVNKLAEYEDEYENEEE